MGDDIGSGLLSMAVCFDFRSTNIVQLSNWNQCFYRFGCHHPLITQLRFLHTSYKLNWPKVFLLFICFCGCLHTFGNQNLHWFEMLKRENWSCLPFGFIEQEPYILGELFLGLKVNENKNS